MKTETPETKKGKSAMQTGTVLYILLIITLVTLGLNQYAMANISSSLDKPVKSPAAVIGNAVAIQPQQKSNLAMQEAAIKIMPRGVPDKYGTELKVSFDDPVKGIDILAALDADLNPGQGGITFDELSGPQKQRYLNVGMSIACEFCCGAKTLIQKNGQPACGCAHSAAMRGIAKYLLKNHENEYTDGQILEELTKWKILFFPKPMLERYLQNQGGSLAPSQLPNQVGGC